MGCGGQSFVQLAKGAVTTTHAAGTATTTPSNMIRVKGHNAVLVKVEVTGSGYWTISLTGMMEENGTTFVNLYDANGNQMSTGSKAASGMYLFVGIPDFIKVVATEDSGTATVAVKVQPISV